MIFEHEEEKNKKNQSDDLSEIAKQTNKQQRLYSELNKCFDSLICYHDIWMEFYKGALENQTSAFLINSFVAEKYTVYQEELNLLIKRLIDLNIESPSLNNTEIINEQLNKVEPWRIEMNRMQDNFVFNKNITDISTKVVRGLPLTEHEETDYIIYVINSYFLKNIGNLPIYLRNVLSELKSVAFEPSSFEPIRLTAKCSKNEIPTIFYNLLKDGKINSTATNIKNILFNILRDNDGNQLSLNTLNDIFNHSKPEARSSKV